MGYHTDFSGKLSFTRPLSSEQKTYLNTILGEWCVNHPEWNVPHLRYGVDLKLLDDESGLKWNGAEKTYANDSSNNNYNGSENGTITYEKGVIGKSVFISGNNNYITVPHNSDISFPKGSEYTTSIWLFINEEVPDNKYHKIFFKGIDGVGANYGLELGQDSIYLNSDTRISFKQPIGYWVHIVSLYRNDHFEMYMNGKQIELNSTGTTHFTTTTNPLSIGNSYISDYVTSWSGKVDDFRIYNRALTQPEINALYFLGSGQIVNNITEENTQNSDLIALKDLIKKDGLYYGVDDNTLYVSKNGDTYISLHDSNKIFNALAATKNNVIAVGESGQIICYNTINQTVEIIEIPNLYDDLLDIDSNGNNTVMISGQNGSHKIYRKRNRGHENQFFKVYA
ncbi:hypothetical protein MHK_008322 [Candidatus Magnetomorum sp. HK-1]|nr:hypothetical protein MHK_008322 [Candidatus Magnetomorum sp. HK-1]